MWRESHDVDEGVLGDGEVEHVGGRAHVHALVVGLFGAEAGHGEGHGDEAAVGDLLREVGCGGWGGGAEEEGADAGADAVAADYFFGGKERKG